MIGVRATPAEAAFRRDADARIAAYFTPALCAVCSLHLRDPACRGCTAPDCPRQRRAG